MKEFIPVTVKEVDEAWGNANFGHKLNGQRMDVVRGSLLKWASDYSTGHTAFSILLELDLITERRRLTSRGRRQL